MFGSVGILYIVATPIGNLEDITMRALAVLREVDFILCEDTRVTRKLLDHYTIEKPLISYHQHSGLQKVNFIVDLLKQGKNVALVSDAGTPGISDPGNELVHDVVDQFFGSSVLRLKNSETDTLIHRQTEKLKIVPIPGPSAVTAIASIAGFSMDKFLFLGFPPHKKGRNAYFDRIATSDVSVVFYESPYRIVKSLKELHEAMKQRNNGIMGIVVGRELTKKFETVYRGTVEEVVKQIEKEGPRGEYVIAILR